MILVRDVFQIKVGHMDQVLALLNDAAESMPENSRISRVLTDISGPHFTLVFESKAESVDAHREQMMASFQDPATAAAMGRMMEYIESGHRTYYTIEYEAGE